MWISSTWDKQTHTPSLFHNHHHEIPLHWANSSYHLSLGIGSLNSSNCSFYWLKPIYYQQAVLQTSSQPTKSLWWSSFHHFSCWYVPCHLSYWVWEGWKCSPGHQKHSKMWRTVPSPLRQFTATWRKLVWRLWWSKNALSFAHHHRRARLDFALSIRIDYWGLEACYMVRWDEINHIGSDGRNGLGKGQERASVIGLWREQSSLGRVSDDMELYDLGRSWNGLQDWW